MILTLLYKTLNKIQSLLTIALNLGPGLGPAAAAWGGLRRRPCIQNPKVRAAGEPSLSKSGWLDLLVSNRGSRFFVDVYSCTSKRTGIVSFIVVPVN